ncbi:hypothetical protein B0H10DRAFT_1970153 [Mycena sp. CBHHK59/15]|nr:hypothetical protein B0H10DRAFT_1970153 [Mycena sp. CBHHK59/15]
MRARHFFYVACRVGDDQRETGANKTLLTEKITIDPPAQFAKLSLHKNAKATQPVIDSESRDDDSETSSEDQGPLPRSERFREVATNASPPKRAPHELGSER